MSEQKGVIQQFFSEAWWLVLLRGIALVVLGGLLLSKPGITVLVWVQFLGAYFFVDGIFSVLKSIRGRKYMKGWGLGIFVGVLEILTGLFVFAHPLATTVLTAGFLVYLVGFMAIFFGIFGVVTGIQVRKEIKGEWAMIVGGVLAIIFGLILIKNPQATSLVYLTIMGVLAVIGGIINILTAFMLRKVGNKGLEAGI